MPLGDGGLTDAADAVWHPSPNFGPRRGCAAPDLIVLHYTAMDSAEAARDWLCHAPAQVSAHYVVAENGRLWQLVREDARAWHAGAGAWGQVCDVNSHSIGIEIANTGMQPFPEPQMAVVERLVAEIMARWRIPAAGVIGHSDCAPGRKIDPGRRFDWRRLARRGLSIWPDETAKAALARQTPDEGRFGHDARRFGYDWSPETAEPVLAAFRMRFRPYAQGPLEAADMAVMAQLACNWPAEHLARGGHSSR